MEERRAEGSKSFAAPDGWLTNKLIAMGQRNRVWLESEYPKHQCDRDLARAFQVRWPLSLCGWLFLGTMPVNGLTRGFGSRQGWDVGAVHCDSSGIYAVQVVTQTCGVCTWGVWSHLVQLC